MAVNTSGNQNKPQNQAFANALNEAKEHQAKPEAQPTQQNTQGGGGQRQQQSGGRRGGIMDINSVMSRPMSRRSTGESVQRYHEVLSEMMEKNFKSGFGQDFEIIVLDNNVVNVGPLSSLLICYYERQGESYNAAVYTLLVEGSAEKLEPKVINTGNRNITIDTVAGDVFNDQLWAKISDQVKQTRGRQVTVLDAGAMVLPSTLSYEDEYHMRSVLFNASQACYTIMENNVGGGEEPFTVGLVNTNAESLVARLSYSASDDIDSGQAETATGQPVRSDVRITLAGDLNQQYNDGDFKQSRALATVDGYVDLVYCPPQQQAAPGQPLPTQHYYPRFVMTKMDTSIDAVTMELQLLSLAQSTLLTRQMAWAGCFKPSPATKNLDLGNVGAVGYEVPLSGDPQAKLEAVDTKAKSFGLPELHQLITMTMHDSLIFSMDIEEVGDLSWIQQAFIAAANGNQDATNMIIEAANVLTQGGFANHFPINEPIAVDDQNRIHLGHYKDSDGVKRDIRDIDYLAMLNIAGKDDPSAVVKWGETFDNTGIPLEIRLNDRADILRAVFSDTVHITGYARRITFNPNFLMALNKGCADAGLVIRPNNLIHEFAGGSVRGNTSAGQFGLSGQAAGGLFNYNSSPYGNMRNQGSSNFQGSYGRRTF